MDAATLQSTLPCFYWRHQIERKMIAIRSFGGCFIFYRAGEMYLLSSREVLRVLNYRIIE
jgi:hypothetical protein